MFKTIRLSNKLVPNRNDNNKPVFNKNNSIKLVFGRNNNDSKIKFDDNDVKYAKKSENKKLKIS